MGQALGGSIDRLGLGKYGTNLAHNMVGGIANAATRSLVNGSDFGDNLMAALPDILGNTIGNALGDAVASRGRRGGSGQPTNLLAGTPYDGPGAGSSSVANLTYESGVPQNGTDGPPSADGAYGGGRAGTGAGGNPAPSAARPFVVSSDAEQLAIATGSTATGSAPFPDAAQAEYQQWVSANGMKASPAGWSAESQYLTSKYLPAGYAAQGAAEWTDFAKAYQSGAPVSLALTYPVQSEVSLISQLDGQLMTSTTGAFVWGELNAGSFGVAGAFDRTGAVQAAADRHPYAQYAGVGASILVGGVGSIGKVGVAESGMSQAVRLGREGEIAAGITGPKVGVTINGRLRFPDGMTPTLIKEVKNVGRQGWTRQLRDYADLARSEGKTFELWIRPDTRISRVLDAAEKRGEVVFKFIGGK